MGYRINHAAVMRQADSMSEDAERMRGQIRQLAQLEQDFRSAWKGQASETFLRKLSALRSDMERTRPQISNLAQTIRHCADRIRREDEEAERRAAALRSGN